MKGKTKLPIRVVFVCLGNICRSPVAEAVFRDIVNQRGLGSNFIIDSAGTGSWHLGHAPDDRMRGTAEERGISMSNMFARQFTEKDFQDFDHIFAMDRDNLQDILYLAGAEDVQYKVRLFREADPEPGNYQVPDPYYGGADGFTNVFDMVTRTSLALVDAFEKEFDLKQGL